MYASGLTGPDIARQTGVPITTVYRLLSEAGVERRGTGRHRFTPEQEARIIARYRAGETYAQIAEALGCSTNAIARLAHVAGIARKSGGMRPGVFSAEQRQAISERTRGDRHPGWKGGRTVEPSGYVLVKATADDSIGLAMAQRPNRYVREHRLVMAHHLGRTLRNDETVHHKNGDKADNRIENLELRVGGHGKGATHAHCATCTCFD